MINIRSKAPWLEDFLKAFANKIEKKEVTAEPTTPAPLVDQLPVAPLAATPQQQTPPAPQPLGENSKGSDTSAYLVSNPWDPRDKNYMGDTNNPNNPDPNDLIAVSRNINPILEDHRKYLPEISWNNTRFWVWSNGNDTILVNDKNTKAQTIEYYTTLDKVLQHLNGANPAPDVQMFSTAPAAPAGGAPDMGLGGGDFGGLDMGGDLGGGDLEMPLASRQKDRLVREAEFYDITEDPAFAEELMKIKPYLREESEESNDENEIVANQEEQKIIESTIETEDVDSREGSSEEMKELVNSIMSRIRRVRNAEAAGQEFARHDPGNEYDLALDAEEVSEFQTSAKETEQHIQSDLSRDLSTPAGRYGENDQHPTEQQYNRTNPGDIYNLNIRETEVRDFEDAAQVTEEQIGRENNTDRTTVPGRYSRPNAAANRIMERILQARNVVAEAEELDEEILADEDLNCGPEDEKIVLLSSLLAPRTIQAEELLPDELDLDVEKDEDEEFFNPEAETNHNELLASNSIYRRVKALRN